MKKQLTLKRNCTARWGIAALMAASAPAFAQGTPPDAGQTLHELQSQPAAPGTHNATNLMVPADADTVADSGMAFPVKKVQVEGNIAVSSDELTPLVAPLEGKKVTLGELRQAAARITARYREHGYVVARAFVPAQEIRDGVVRIAVLEGKLASTSFINNSVIGTPTLEAISAAQNLNGKTIHSAECDRELLLMADLPGAGPVSGTLKPGQEVGTSDMVVKVDPGKSHEGQVSIDNYGNRYTGQIRTNANVDFNSPLKIGDKLSLRATATNEHLLYGQVSYDLPANSDGWRVGGYLSSNSYELGKEFDSLDASGRSNTTGLYTSDPLLRGLNANIWLSGSVEYHDLKDEVRATDITTNKNVTVATVEAYGDLADSFGGGAYSTWRTTLASGRLDIESDDALVIDQAGPKANGDYQNFKLLATRLQAVTPHTSAFVSVAAQWADKNLDSSEKFVLGGMNGVRAYPQGEGVGDEGWLAKVELRHDFWSGIQASAFYDHGHVKYNNHDFAFGNNDTTLKGYGLAVASRYELYELKGTVAWPNGPDAVSAPDRSPRFWLALQRGF